MSTYDSRVAPKRCEFNLGGQQGKNWRERAKMCIELLERLVARCGNERMAVADVGCGDMKLKKLLQRRANRFTYTGYDLLPQSTDIRPLDIRSQPLPEEYEVVVMLGVGEYLENLSAVLVRLAKETPHLIMSHVIRQDAYPYTPEQLAELGWCNHLALKDVETLLDNSGFDTWDSVVTPDRRTAIWLCRSRRYKLAA